MNVAKMVVVTAFATRMETAHFTHAEIELRSTNNYKMKTWLCIGLSFGSASVPEP